MAGDQVNETISALTEINWPTIFVYPNGDAGSELHSIQTDETETATYTPVPQPAAPGLSRVDEDGRRGGGKFEQRHHGGSKFRQAGGKHWAAARMAGPGGKRCERSESQRRNRHRGSRGNKPRIRGARKTSAQNPYGDGTASAKDRRHPERRLRSIIRLLQKEMAY